MGGVGWKSRRTQLKQKRLRWHRIMTQNGTKSAQTTVLAGVTLAWAVTALTIGGSSAMLTPFTTYLSGGAGCATNPATGTWSTLIPPSRFASASASDTTAGNPYVGTTLMFGGVSGGSQYPLGDTWEYSHGCWTQICASACVPCSNSGVAESNGCALSFCTSGGDTFGYTGGLQSCVVPSGITSVSATVYGAAGGNGYSGTYGVGGKGGEVSVTSLTVTPGSVLYIYVGGAGVSNTSDSAGGYDGGGGSCSTGTYCDDYKSTYPGSGGGGSDIQTSSAQYSSQLVVAGGGGGGGGGYYTTATFGAGGLGGSAAAGGNGGTGGEGYGTNCETPAEGGGGEVPGGGPGGSCLTGYTGGTGALGTGGAGADVGVSGDQEYFGGGGGGGGGYYGGGGGGDDCYATSTHCVEPPTSFTQGGGGGGGSSYCSSSCGGTIAYSQGVQSGNGEVVITFSGGSTSIGLEPVPRFGAAMAWDPSVGTSGAFILYGGCSNDLITTGGFYPDTCNRTATSVLSDTWAFQPTGPGTGTWSFLSSATCQTIGTQAVGYPYTSTDEYAGASALSPSISAANCLFTSYTYTSDCYSTDVYCYAAGVYGASMAYDADTTQCNNGGGYTCVLLYGGSNFFPTSIATDIGPCAQNYVHTYKVYCSDMLWELSGSSLSTLAWTEENDAVTNGDGATGSTGTGGYTTNGRAWFTMEAAPCKSAACTLVMTGGIDEASSAYGETSLADSWYLTATVATAWTKMAPTGSYVNVPASEMANEAYDNVPASLDSTLNGTLIYFGGQSSTGNGYTAGSGTIYCMNPSSVATAGYGWLNKCGPSSSTLTGEDLASATTFWDDNPFTGYVIIFGGWDNAVNGNSAIEGAGGEYVLV